MKHEWRKHEKQIYNATTSPARLTIPPQQFLILNGSVIPTRQTFPSAFLRSTPQLTPLSDSIALVFQQMHPSTISPSIRWKDYGRRTTTAH